MSNETEQRELEALYSNNRIKLACSKLETRDDVKQDAIYLLTEMRDNYERDRKFWANDRTRLHERIAALEAELEAAQEWQPVPDGMYEYPNWNNKGMVIIRILNDGAELEQWHNSLPDDIEEISLSSDYRLCQRKQNVQETESC